MEAQLQNPSITSCTNISEPISSSLIDKVLSQAQAFASHSWEYGIVFEALLEYHNPILTTFHTPGRQHQSALSSISEEVPALEYIKRFVHTDGTTLCEGNGKVYVYLSLLAHFTILTHYLRLRGRSSLPRHSCSLPQYFLSRSLLPFSRSASIGPPPTHRPPPP